MKKLIFSIFLFASIGLVYCRHFEFCELVDELRDQGFPLEHLPSWACLVEWESSRKTTAINRDNGDGSTDYGLFQINNMWWCKDPNFPRGHVNNLCHIDCRELLTDDISVASRCAQRIYRESGFSAWVAWRNKCQEHQLTDYRRKVNECLGFSNRRSHFGVGFHSEF